MYRSNPSFGSRKYTASEADLRGTWIAVNLCTLSQYGRGVRGFYSVIGAFTGPRWRRKRLYFNRGHSHASAVLL